MKEEMDEQPETFGIHSLGWRMTCSMLVENIGKKEGEELMNKMNPFHLKKNCLGSSHEWTMIHEMLAIMCSWVPLSILKYL